MTKQSSHHIDPSPTNDDMVQLDSRLREFNRGQTGRHDFEPVQLVVRADDGTMIAGLKGLTGWDWLYVEILWVQAEHRGSGIGSQLLLAAEAQARQRGCIGACLSSFNFQAPGFYERHGYSSRGQIDDYPQHHTMYFMAKRFEDAER